MTMFEKNVLGGENITWKTKSNIFVNANSVSSSIIPVAGWSSIDVDSS